MAVCYGGQKYLFTIYKAGCGGIVKGSRKNCPSGRELKRRGGQGYEVRAGARGAGRRNMERAGGKDRGALSQWRGRKIIAEMIKAKVMELQVVDVDLATSWRDEGTAGRCEEQPKPKAKAAQTRLIFINPTTPLPYFLIVTIIAIPKLFIQKFKRPLWDPTSAPKLDSAWQPINISVVVTHWCWGGVSVQICWS